MNQGKKVKQNGVVLVMVA